MKYEMYGCMDVYLDVYLDIYMYIYIERENNRYMHTYYQHHNSNNNNHILTCTRFSDYETVFLFGRCMGSGKSFKQALLLRCVMI